MNVQNIFYIFLFFIFFCGSFCENIYDQTQIEWENYYSTIISNYIYSSFRYPTELNFPSFTINKKSQPCELFTFSNNNPSINKLFFNMENINNSSYRFNENLKCYTDNNNLEDCKINLPISRCIDNDSPNLSDIKTILSFIDKGFNLKNSLKSYFSSKQSYFYYVSSFLNNYKSVDQYNRSNSYWNEMIEQLEFVINNFINLSQSPIPKDIQSILSPINPLILSDSLKSKIIDQTSFTINKLLNSLNSLLNVLQSLPNYSPYSSSSSSSSSSFTSSSQLSINSTLTNILNDLKQLNDFQISNLNIFFGLTNQFEIEIPNLFEPGQTLLEYYLEFTTSSTLIESLVNELLLLNNLSNSKLKTITQEYQNLNFNKLKSIESNLLIISNLIKSSSNLISSSNQTSLTSLNYFNCDFNIINSIYKSFNQIISPPFYSSSSFSTSYNYDLSKKITFEDIGYCRDLVKKIKSTTLELTILNQLTGTGQLIGIGNGGTDILMYDFGNRDNVKFITSSLFSNVVKSSDSLLFQKDGYVLNLIYPKSTNKPIIYPPPIIVPPTVGTSSPTSCPYPTCKLKSQSGCLSDVPSNFYYNIDGVCDLCQGIPENSVNSYLLSNGKIGTSSICPYLCALPKQYKLGVWNDYNFQPCIETPIGYYSNLMNNSITECSLPTSPSIFTIDPNRLWFGSNAATDSCLVTPKYQLIFINSDYNLPRNILPTEVLNRGTTIEMWLKIDSTNLPKVDSIVGITGIYQSWELSFIYITLNKTITPAITNPVNQQIIFQDSTVSSIILPNSFFHFAVIVETNNIIGFYINGERVGRTIFTVTAFNGKTNYQYIGGSQFNRLSFIIDEFKTYNRALSPNELGYKNTNQMIISSCNPQNGEILCDGNCVSSCLDSLGLYLNSTDCTCHCKDSSKEIIVNGGGLTYCLPKCPINSYRNLNDPLQCDCVDGEFKVLKTKQVKISSIYQYDKIDNYYSNNIDKKVGLLSVRIFNERGELVKPISCSSSSNDGSGNTCNNLFDENANSYWCTSGQTGFGYVLLNLPTITTIARISITPLPNPTTMKEISISISTETSSFINYEVVVIKSTLPLQVNQVDIDYETVSSKNVTSFTCIACPTIPTFKESQSSPKYIYPPISSLPRNEMKSCGCFGRFSFDQSSFSCMPPLPSPTFTLPSGSYKTETIVNIVYDIQVTTGYRLLYTIDSSDPVETSTDFPINQGITFKDIDRVELKVRSFKSGRLASDVSSGIYKIQGVIDCTLTPSPTLNNSVEPFIFDEKVNVLINCKTIPAINSISSSWIYYSTDLIDPPTNKYNPKYGVNLIAEPTIGTNTITLKVLSKLDQYFSFTGDFLFKIQPTIPPPIISPPDQINFTNSVPIKILIPSIEDTTSTSITTITYYKNYSIYYDLIDQGISNPPPLNSSKGKEYFQNDYLIIQCTTPESGCLLHLRAIGCINQACSRITQKYFKLTFDFDQLLPTIKSKYQKDSNSYLITIQSNSLLVGIKTLYQYTLIKSSSDLSICQSTLDIQVSNSLEYVNPFNISSVEKGYYCICLKNFKNFYNKLLNSKQLCRILVYTYQMDSPIFLQYGEYISNSLEFGIYPNTKNFQHNGEFKVEVGNGDATEDSQSLNGTNLILKLSPSLSYQKFSISAIDCPKDFICSEPSNSEIILRDKCSDPYVSKPSGIYYNNITIYGNCDNGCLAVVEFINSSNQNDPALIPTPQSQLFPSSLFLSSPNSDETVTIFLMMCVNSFKANSNTLDFIYTIEKYLRPSKPIINPGQGGYLDRSKNQFITMACSTLYPNETCSIFFSIRYSNSKSNVPLLIDAIKQPIGSNYDYQYVGKFVPNYVGTFYIVAIATVEKSTQSYDYLYSTESMVSITVYGDRPKIEMVPLVTSFYPSASISLISTSTTDINDLIFIYVSIFNDTYYKTIPPLYNFKNYDSTVDDSLTISVNTTIYAYIQGKYYNLIDNSSIQSFSLYYNKQKDEEVYPSSNENDKADGNTKISPLIFLLLLFIPLIIEMSIKTGLKTD